MLYYRRVFPAVATHSHHVAVDNYFMMYFRVRSGDGHDENLVESMRCCRVESNAAGLLSEGMENMPHGLFWCTSGNKNRFRPELLSKTWMYSSFTHVGCIFFISFRILSEMLFILPSVHWHYWLGSRTGMSFLSLFYYGTWGYIHIEPVVHLCHFRKATHTFLSLCSRYWTKCPKVYHN